MRQEQEDSWRDQEARLQELIARGNKEAFFEGITPLFGRLKSFVKRILRAAYLEREIKTPVYTSDDILDQAILKAYDNFEKKPAELTLEHWLYQLVNETLLNYLRPAEVCRRQAQKSGNIWSGRAAHAGGSGTYDGRC